MAFCQDLPNLIQKLLGCDRFFQKISHVRQGIAQRKHTIQTAGKKQDTDLRCPSTNRPRQLHSIHSRHEYIGDQKIDCPVPFLTYPQSLLSGIRLQDVKVDLLQDSDDQVPERRIVFDQQNGPFSSKYQGSFPPYPPCTPRVIVFLST